MCRDNNKCFGCSGANMLLHPRGLGRSSEAPTASPSFTCGNLANKKLQIIGGNSCAQRPCYSSPEIQSFKGKGHFQSVILCFFFTLF